MSDHEILDRLRADGLISSTHPTLTPFGGGVSSDVWRVDDGAHTFVVKRSVAKLRVAADWFSDPARLRCEFLYLQTAAEILPDAVPRLLSSDPDAPFIALEYLGEGFENWKSRLLNADLREADAYRAGAILGQIHAATRDRTEIAQRFERIDFFVQLRVDAYLRATATKQAPDVAAAIEAEAHRLTTHRECLVHGDFSPKNMLASTERFVVLDCETACHGDPAFDLAFVLNHLCLKALFHAPRHIDFAPLIEALLTAYRGADPKHATAVEERSATLLPILLLARADGKSPVEYLDDPKREVIRQFAPSWITAPSPSLAPLVFAWLARVRALTTNP